MSKRFKVSHVEELPDILRQFIAFSRTSSNLQERDNILGQRIYLEVEKVKPVRSGLYVSGLEHAVCYAADLKDYSKIDPRIDISMIALHDKEKNIVYTFSIAFETRIADIMIAVCTKNLRNNAYPPVMDTEMLGKYEPMFPALLKHASKQGDTHVLSADIKALREVLEGGIKSDGHAVRRGAYSYFLYARGCKFKKDMNTDLPPRYGLWKRMDM